MLDGPAFVSALQACGVTHVVWIPDSLTGTWEPALSASRDLTLIRACREGEAIGVAAGLWLGGARPVVVMQCTGLFEAGDALRNAVHDLGVPLFLLIGVRSWHAHEERKTTDNCPVFTTPILDAWKIPHAMVQTPADLTAEYNQAQAARRCGCVLLAE